MNSTFTYNRPDEAFWGKYTDLWQHSIGRSPFQSPQILQYFSAQSEEELAVFQYFNEGGDLVGAVLLEQENGGFHFLSDRKTDANFFTLHQDCTAAEVSDFFVQFLQAVKKEKKALMLNNQPAWAPYMQDFNAAGQASGLYWLNMKYSVCPVAIAENPDALFDKINSSRELRYRVNKLKKQKEAIFEVYTDGTDLDHWIDEFCNAHVLRWDGTSTPSAFRDPARRKFLKGCMDAWSREGILVRFSVSVQGSRVGFVVSLREANSLIHHSTTFHPDYRKFSPGKALIHFMAEWMKDHQINALDFGDGNEPYKYTVANEEQILNRIFAADKSNVRFILKSKLIQWVRQNAKAYNYYLSKVKPLLGYMGNLFAKEKASAL